MTSASAAQMLFDGSVEEANSEGLSLQEFMRVSEAESGLLRPAAAALILDVSNQRILQLCDAGTLKSWEFLGNRYVSAREIDARRGREIKSGRRLKTVSEKLKQNGKMMGTASISQVLAIAK